MDQESASLMLETLKTLQKQVAEIQEERRREKKGKDKPELKSDDDEEIPADDDVKSQEQWKKFLRRKEKKETRGDHEKESLLEIREAVINKTKKETLTIIDERLTIIKESELFGWNKVEKVNEAIDFGISQEKLEFYNAFKLKDNQPRKKENFKNNRSRGNSNFRGQNSSRGRGEKKKE